MLLKECRKLQIMSTSGPSSLPSSAGKAGCMRTLAGGKDGRSGGGGRGAPSTNILQGTSQQSGDTQEEQGRWKVNHLSKQGCPPATHSETVHVNMPVAQNVKLLVCLSPRVALLLLGQQCLHLNVQVVAGPCMGVALA